jgi:hypothetical protein
MPLFTDGSSIGAVRPMMSRASVVSPLEAHGKPAVGLPRTQKIAQSMDSANDH